MSIMMAMPATWTLSGPGEHRSVDTLHIPNGRVQAPQVHRSPHASRPSHGDVTLISNTASSALYQYVYAYINLASALGIPADK